MAKLHEILAVSEGLNTTAKKIAEETITTFNKKDEHFVAYSTNIEYFAEEDRKLDTKDSKEMVTTVVDKLKWNAKSQIKAIDAYLKKEATNQQAKADIVIGDQVIASGIPGVVLLGLETKLAELRKVYEAIPTLAPGPKWTKDEERGANIFRNENLDTKFITRKNIRPIVMAPATEHHPAQIQAVTEDINVAKKSIQVWSGMMSSASKSDLLERLDTLLRAVKKARQRANNTDVVNAKVGEALFSYLHDGIVT